MNNLLYVFGYYFPLTTIQSMDNDCVVGVLGQNDHVQHLRRTSWGLEVDLASPNFKRQLRETSTVYKND